MSAAKTAARDIFLGTLLFGAALVVTGEFQFRSDSPATAFAVLWASHVGLTLWSLYKEARRSSRRLTPLAADVGQPTLEGVTEVERAPRL